MHSSSALWVFGRGAVDLVGQDDLGHDRPRPELELGRLLVEDRQAGHVRRQQVGGELDAAEAAADALAERLGEHRLADAGHVLDEDVALAQQRHQRHPHLDVLADDHALHAGDHALGGLLDVLHDGSGLPCSGMWAPRRGPAHCCKTIPQPVTRRFRPTRGLDVSWSPSVTDRAACRSRRATVRRGRAQPHPIVFSRSRRI